MSALARYFRQTGKSVSGYDKTVSILTEELGKEGIDIHFEDDMQKIRKEFIKDPEHTLIIYTPAVPANHKQKNYFLDHGYVVRKRSEVLGMITENSYTIAVAGTHGKTTTSSMIAHILKFSGKNCSAFLGGISKNYNTNLLLSTAQTGEHFFVVEADEYDRSFLSLSPMISVITSMDADHLDIYGSESFMIESYRMFAERLRKQGTLIYRLGLPLGDLDIPKKTYKMTGAADYSADNVRTENHQYHFVWKGNGERFEDVTSEMPGHHNVENAVAAIAVAHQIGISKEHIVSAMASYTGVRRRFDYQVRDDNRIYIDDYAHHPEELRACITSVRELYPGKRVTGIFQPHLFTRTRDFAEGFAKSLSLLDSLLLLPIYPAREEPIEGVTSQLVFDGVSILDKVLCEKNEVINELKKRELEVVLTLGAGDIDQLVKPIREFLEKEYAK